MSDMIERRAYDGLSDSLALAKNAVYKEYLEQLQEYPLVLPGVKLMEETPRDCLRMFRLKQLTCTQGEDIFQKLSTVYHAAMSAGCSLYVMVEAPDPHAPVEFYLGVRAPYATEYTMGNATQSDARRVSYNALKNGFLSHFPGSDAADVSSFNTVPVMLDNIFGDDTRCIASVSCVASMRDKSRTEHKSFVQGLEKLVDVMRGRSYTALLIADPVTREQQSEIRVGYESLYSALSSFSKSVWSWQENESRAVMENLSHSVTESVTEGVAHTQSHTISNTVGNGSSTGANLNAGINSGLSQSFGQGYADSVSTSHATSHGTTSRSKQALAGSALGIVGDALQVIGGPIGWIGRGLHAVGGVMSGASETNSVTDAVARGVTNSIISTVGQSLGLSGGIGGNYSRNKFQSETNADGVSEARNQSTSRGATNSRTTGTSDTKGMGRTLQIETTNKPIEELLKRIETQLDRTRETEDYGAYSCGAYFLSYSQDDCLLAANTYRALMLGEGSAVERGAVNVWTDPEIVANMKEYLRRFAQPVFAMPAMRDENGEIRYMVQTPGTIVSGLELPLHLGLPTQSVMGLPVIDHAVFGRNVLSGEAETVELGNLYHMGRTEYAKVRLDLQSLAAHTFITGSTGAGKTNTVCALLRRICLEQERPKLSGTDSDSGCPTFLVIEPAKGEYKNILGGLEGVSVYGTNPKKTPLLRLNPFSFPEDIHVLEHIDRLVEIFNACWPMYAAMPAVLKDAIESAYQECGWSLSRSVCPSGRFPSFSDVLRKLPEVMRASDYSADTKGDYTGALVTRVKSLTNGINGRIFCADEELSNEALFNRNVIADLSRIGSMESKSLLMGILTMKLLEYRMSQSEGGNVPLRHITVLEEAHNLLRRTSTEQSQESSNLQGKSVEMLSNAIAEMRSYGEGFVIADQAPGLLDMAVIRNTNTKIIHRLPDESDRVLVGRATGLDDAQIAELSRLDIGVAAVFQNHWQEPTLCKVEKFPKNGRKAYANLREALPSSDRNTPFFRRVLYGVQDGMELSEEQIDRLALWIDRLDTGRAAKELLHSVLRGEELDDAKRRWLSYCLLRGRTLIENAEKQSPEEARAMADSQAMDSLEISAELAAEARRLAFLYAAEEVRQDEVRYRELLLYGGVR